MNRLRALALAAVFLLAASAQGAAATNVAAPNARGLVELFASYGERVTGGPGAQKAVV